MNVHQHAGIYLFFTFLHFISSLIFFRMHHVVYASIWTSEQSDGWINGWMDDWMVDAIWITNRANILESIYCWNRFRTGIALKLQSANSVGIIGDLVDWEKTESKQINLKFIY